MSDMVKVTPKNIVDEARDMPWKVAIEPFRVAPRVYYVGNVWVGSFLVDTEEGLAIIDTTVMEDLYLLLESIRKLGFDPMNIKKIFLTHAHMDHDGAARALKEMTGAEIYLSKEDEDWRHRPEADMHDTGFKIVPYDVDHFYDDNEAIVMGSVTIRTKLSAGHTPGHPSHSNMLSLIPENRMDYTPFVDADKWPAFLDERVESLRKVIAAGKYER